MPATIKTLHKIRGLGVFLDHTHAADVPEFRRYNLIYGFNGSGKTTLSRLLRCLELGIITEHFAPEGEFTVHFSDGNAVTHQTAKGAANDSIAVFNADFIEENLRWREGRVSPVFFIGTQQTRLSELVELLTARLPARQAAATVAADAKSRAINAFAGFKRETARLISEGLGLGRRYTAPTLEQDMAHFQVADGMLLSEEELSRKKALYYATSAGSPIPALATLSVEVVDYLQRVLLHCKTSFSGAVIAALKEHAEMLKWAKDGLDYHTSHSLSDCLFCGNALTPKRIDLLEKSIDDQFARTVAETHALQTERGHLLDALDVWWNTVPAKSAFDPSLTDAYTPVRAALEATKEAIRQQLIQVRTWLQEKAAAPNLAVPVPDAELAAAAQRVEALNNSREDATKLITAHNAKIDGFEEEKKQAGVAMKRHFLASAAGEYANALNVLAAAEHEADMRERLHRRLVQAVAAKRQQLRQHGLAVDPINRLLAAYLGHGDLALISLEEGYQIQRKGSPIKGPLSEGEKTAVAICYFLSKLDENGRKRKDIIAVIDDPISSLDTRALNYALNLLKRALEPAAQVIILTHNLYFMNETKKWLKPMARDEAGRSPTASLYFLDVRLGNDGTRSSKIGLLPKLLREYDSEYHNLFSLVHAFSENEAEHAHLGFVLPNVMRKVLELFLTFKLPGSDGLDSKLNQPLVRDCGLDQARIGALSRLVQVESHGDSLDDLLTFSSMTVEETRGAAVALFELMQRLDEPHLSRMRRLCR